MATYPGWEAQTLAQLGVTNPTAVKKDTAFLDAWQRAEGGTAAYNPLNTTQPEQGDSFYNSFGPNGMYHVRNYPSAVAGTSATSTTLTNGHYGTVLAALRAGNPDQLFNTQDARVQSFGEISKWGSNPSTVVADYNLLTGSRYPTISGASQGTVAGKVAGAVGGAVSTAAGDAAKPFVDTYHTLDSAGKALSFIFSYRFLEIVAGGLLLLLGLYLLAQQFKQTFPVPGPVKSAADPFKQGTATQERVESRNAGKREVRRRAQGLTATQEANLAGRKAERATANL